MRLRRSGREPSSVWRYSLPLAVCFFLGILAGTVCATRTGGSVGEELKNYLSAYLTAAQGREISVSVLCTLALAYLWGPVLSFFCGFFAAGAVLLPLLTAAFGFLPAYAVSCLTAAFGGQGVWLAVGFFGLRCLLTIPCFFLLAPPSFQSAAGRLGASLGRGRFVPPDSRGCWLRFAGVILALGLGIYGDLRLSPFLLRVLLEQVF